MDIRMKRAESLYLESTVRSAEAKDGKEPGETVSAAGGSETEKVTKTVQLDQTTGLTSVEKAGKAAEVRQPSYDKFIPEKPEGPKSFGHYHPVADGKGGVQIRFDAPTEDTAKTENRDPSTAEQAFPIKDGEAGEEARLEQKGTTEAKDKEPEKTDANEVLEGQTKVQKLKTKKKQLEQKIKNAADPSEAEKLRRKLAQVKRELSAAGK